MFHKFVKYCNEYDEIEFEYCVDCGCNREDDQIFETCEDFENDVKTQKVLES